MAREPLVTKKMIWGWLNALAGFLAGVLATSWWMHGTMPGPNGWLWPPVIWAAGGSGDRGDDCNPGSNPLEAV